MLAGFMYLFLVSGYRVITNDESLNSRYSPRHYILVMPICKTTVKSLGLFQTQLFKKHASLSSK